MLTKHEQFVADWFLSEYPKDKTFDELCKLAHDDANELNFQDFGEVIIWEPFDYNPEISELMYHMLTELKTTFK